MSLDSRRPSDTVPPPCLPSATPGRGALLPVSLGALAGALALSLLSTFQKLAIGAQLSPVGYVIPLLFGGLAGGAIGWGFHRLRENARALRNAAEQWHVLFEAAPDPALVLDEEGRVLAASRSACEFYGRSAEEIVGLPATELASPLEPGVEGESAPCIQAIERFKETGHCEARARVPELGERQLWCTGRALPSPDGRPLLLRFDRDMTTQRRAEERERQLAARLAEVERTDALGRLAGGIAHDFNNVLQGVTSYLALCQTEDGLPTAVSEDLNEAQQLAEKGQALARQLLTFGRPQSEEAGAIALESVLRGLDPILRRVVLRRSELDLGIEEGAHLVCARRIEIEQILLNLATNARDAMAGQHPALLHIRLERRLANSDECPAEAVGRPFEVIAVADNGCGMDAALLERVFEPFVTTKMAGRGTGLGLSIVRGIVSRAGGFLLVESEPDRGTTIEVWLPSAQ